MQIEQPRKMTFNLNQDAAYDSGLICGGTLEIFVKIPFMMPSFVKVPQIPIFELTSVYNRILIISYYVSTRIAPTLKSICFIIMKGI